MIKRTDISGRVSSWLFNLYHISPEVTQCLAAEKALLIGQIKNSVAAKHRQMLLPILDSLSKSGYLR